MTNIQIGNKIKQRRDELKMSLQDIAENIGVAKSTIQRYESGSIQKIKLPVIESIAKSLKVSPAWLLGKSDVKEIPSSEEHLEEYMNVLKARPELKKLFCIVMNASESEIEKLIKIAETLIDDN